MTLMFPSRAGLTALAALGLGLVTLDAALAQTAPARPRHQQR